MFHYVTFFTVSPEAEAAFVRRLGTGSPWQAHARRIAPALVGADLMHHQSRPLYLCHDFWITPEAYSEACKSEMVRELLDARKRMVDDSFELGAFPFPAIDGASEISKAASAPRDACRPPTGSQQRLCWMSCFKPQSTRQCTTHKPRLARWRRSMPTPPTMTIAVKNSIVTLCSDSFGSCGRTLPSCSVSHEISGKNNCLPMACCQRSRQSK